MITTKEASKLWNISARRISKLASESRIEGAQLIGHSWMIPEDATKPNDARSSNSNNGSERFVYPFIPSYICKENTLYSLNKEEKQLYDICMEYEQGSYETGLIKAKELFVETNNVYIKIGTVYILCFLYVILRKYNEAKQTVVTFYSLCKKIKSHSVEMAILMNDVLFYFEKNATYQRNIPVESNRFYSSFALSYLSCQALINEISNFNENSSVNFNIYELDILRLQKDGYEYLQMFYHFYLSMLYAAVKDFNNEQYHLTEAINIAIKNNTYTSLAGVICYFPDSTIKILEKYPKEIRDKFIYIINLSSLTFGEYQAHIGNNIQLSQLTIEDFKLISYCLKDYTVDMIAEIEKISSSKTKRKLLSLYEKLGISKKTEIKDKYSSVLI